jgi:uncharacterized protein (DUF2235 family)
MASAPRNPVVCCDGTSNEIGKLLSNVMKTYRVAENRQADHLLLASLRTVAMPDSWDRWRQWLRCL